MDQLLEILLTNGIRLPFFSDLLAMDRDLPKSEYLALLVIQRRGEATMSELAADLNAPLSTVTGIGARLENKKLVKREQHPQDRRVITLRLTEAGSELAAQAQALVDEMLSRIQEALSPEEFQQLMGLVQKVFMALQTGSAERREVRQIKIEE